MAKSRKWKDDDEWAVFPLAIRKDSLRDLELTAEDIQQQIDGFLGTLLEAREQHLDALSRCHEGGSVHTTNTLCALTGWVIYNTTSKDRDATSFALYNLVSSMHTLLFGDFDDDTPTTEQQEDFLQVTDEILELADLKIPDKAYFVEVRRLLKIMFGQAHELILSTMEVDT